MPVTLAQAQLNVQDDLIMGVIDEFRKGSYLLGNLIFHDCVSPTGGGATLTHSYARVIEERPAAFREVNTEYTPAEARKERVTVDLKIFGGSFQIDRIIANMGGIIDETNFQLQQLIKSSSATFEDTVINGDAAVDSKSFDGLEVALAGSSTELIPAAAIDLSTSAAMESNAKDLLDILDELEGSTFQRPTAFLGNKKLIAKIKGVARRTGYYTRSEDAFGRKIDGYNGIPLIDLGDKPASTLPIIPVNASGETPLYAVCLGMDALHAISMAGQPPIKTWLPDFSTAGAVKTGECEMVAAIALKHTKGAAVLRKIKVQ